VNTAVPIVGETCEVFGSNNESMSHESGTFVEWMIVWYLRIRGISNTQKSEYQPNIPSF